MFEFKNIYEATTVEEAIRLLTLHPDARIIAGGTDLLLAMREGLLADREVVSINGIRALSGISLDDEKNIHIKSLTTFREIAKSPIIRENIPYFVDAVETIGSPQIRTVATIGGNISNGFTTADSAPTLFSLNALAQVSGPKGDRMMRMQDYYLGPERMDLTAGELLTEIVIPYTEYHGYAGMYIKYAQREAMDIALIGCSVVAKISKDKSKLDDIRISFGAAAPIPVRAYKTEEKAKGMAVSLQLLDFVSKSVKDDISPITCKRATREFRYHLCEVLSKRALSSVLKNLGAESGKIEAGVNES